MFDRPAADDPCTYGFCDLIKSVARKRGFVRDQDQLDSVEQDLRVHLIAQRMTIETALTGKTEKHRANYVRRVLKNYLTNTQTCSEAIVARKSTKSLSPDGPVKTYRKQTGEAMGADVLLDKTDGDSASKYDDHSLDEKETLYTDGTENPSAKTSQKRTARHRFDNRLREAGSLIAALTGGRNDGFDIRLDLQRALTKLSGHEARVFASIYLDENGELLNHRRTYREIEEVSGLTIQNVRTLERHAIQKLRLILSPAFSKEHVPDLGHSEWAETERAL